MYRHNISLKYMYISQYELCIKAKQTKGIMITNRSYQESVSMFTVSLTGQII